MRVHSSHISRARRTAARIAAALVTISPVLTPLILTSCSGDLTGTNISAPASVTKLGTDPTSVTAGASFSDSIRVRVTDVSSNPTSGVSVGFAVLAGSGTVTPATVITDANGKAAAKFITGIAAGGNTATATVTGLAPVTFYITTIAKPTLVWSTVSSGTTQSLFGAWGTSASDVWAVGDAGMILHYDGRNWSVIPRSTSQAIFSVWGTSASDVRAVGENVTPFWNLAPTTMLHYDGMGWSSVSSGTTSDLISVWGTSPSDVWAVGRGGTILHSSPAN